MKLLVTGADGFVGRRLVQTLRQGGCEVMAATRQARPGCVAIGDISGSTDWRAALAGCDAVVHLAARVHHTNESGADAMSAYRRVNVEGSLNLARQARAAGVTRLVFVSTVKVLGEAREQPYVETDTPSPVDAYAVSKWEAEQGLMALAQTESMEVVVVRPPLVYGPGVKGNFATLVRAVIRGWPLPLGAVDNRRSLIGLNNLVDFVALCADSRRSPRAGNQVFLVSDGEAVSTSTLLRQVASAYGVKSRLLPVPAVWLRRMARWLGKEEAAGRLLDSLTVDPSRAQQVLGWRPVMTLEEQLREMAQDDSHP